MEHVTGRANIIVRFPGKRGYYQVTVGRDTANAVERLQWNRLGFYDLVTQCDEPILWKRAQFVTEHLKGLERLEAQPSSR
jgi:hypothetical protein